LNYIFFSLSVLHILLEAPTTSKVYKKQGYAHLYTILKMMQDDHLIVPRKIYLCVSY